MTRIVVATLGSVGDLHPFLAIARHAARQGHSVLFLSSEPHRQAVEAEGLDFEPILSAHDHVRAAQHPDLWHPLRGFGVLWRHLAVRSVDSVVEILQRESGAHSEAVRVLASPLVLGARLMADLLPIRLVTAHTAPSGIRQIGRPLYLGSWRVPDGWPRSWRRLAWRALDRWKLEPMARPGIDQWRHGHGLGPASGSIFGEWLQSPHRVLGLYPAWFSPSAVDSSVDVQPLGFPLFRPSDAPVMDEELTLWLQRRHSRPRLVLYGGSSKGPSGRHFHSAALALDAKGWPSLLIAPDQAPSALGKHGLIRPWTDLASVLPACGGWIHHGGIGACAEGLHAGVRPWTLPLAYDQFDNSERLACHLGFARHEVMLSAQQLSHGQLPGLDALHQWRGPKQVLTANSAAIEATLEALLSA